MRPTRNFTRPRTTASYDRGSSLANDRTSSSVTTRVTLDDLTSLAGPREDRRARVRTETAAGGMFMSQVGRGKKDPNATSGAPFSPAVEHSDGPAERPRRDVPPAETTDDEPTGDEADAQSEEEDDG
jgi:hypothetical protein